VTVFDERVVPHFLYSRDVIEIGLLNREAGVTWERAAVSCTADGQVDVSTLKRWQRRFQLEAGQLLVKPPPAAPFWFAPRDAMLGSPAGSRSPDPSQEDPWARGPPSQL
jgi:hypothetical protein